jgi:N-acetylmuramoyl-L-alanine amidase
MDARTKLFVALAFVTVGIVGCQEPQQRAPRVAIKEQTTTVEDLAVRLGLRVVERGDAFVVLRNSANTVIIFTHNDARFFVNGKPVGSVGVIEKVGSTVYVSRMLADEIRPYLRTAAPEPPVVITPPRRPKLQTRPIVVIDAGHGGDDPGAIGSGGVHEKDVDLGVARKVAALLEQRGVAVVMTRQQDQFIELEERAGIANRQNADLFVSIHADSAPNRQAEGFTVYVSRGASPDSYKAAQAISRAMSGTGSDSRGIREADYRVLVQTTCPAVLVELGYISNATDARHLQDGAYQNRLAQAITEGILACIR